MKVQLAVGAVVLRADGAVLLVRRAHAPAAGSWTLPGGKVEPGETLEQAGVREVEEETGVRVVLGPVIETLELSREGFFYEITDYVAHVASDTRLLARDDVDDARWVMPAELGSYALTPDVLRVIAKAKSV